MSTAHLRAQTAQLFGSGPAGQSGQTGRRRLPAYKTYNPVRLALIALLWAYRLVISPLYGQVCRFHPSCSAYALEAIRLHGALAGCYLAARRLLRCHPWSAGGYDPVPERMSWWTPRGAADPGDQRLDPSIAAHPDQTRPHRPADRRGGNPAARSTTSP
jgi:putative membrane protein insertion efficiency factor